MQKRQNFLIYTFTRPDVNTNEKEDEYEEISNVTDIAELQASAQEVEFYLKNLDVTKTCGPDGIPARILKECSLSVAPSLYKFLNLSLRVCRLPIEWKSANITPVHKKGLKEPAEYYRPVSLIPIIAKVCTQKTLRRRHCLYFLQPTRIPT